MKLRLTPSAILLSLLLAPAVVVSCKEQSETAEARGNSPATAERPSSLKSAKAVTADVSSIAKSEKANSTAASAKEGHGPVIDGERFTVRQIVDREQGGIPVAVFIAPEKWRDQSQVLWN